MGTGKAREGPVISAHARVVLFGEHAVVFGRPALAIAIEHAVVAKSVEYTTQGIEISVEPWGLQAEEGVAGPVGEALRRISAGVPGTGGVRLRAFARIPPGAGLGSSAALATLIAKVLAERRGVSLDESGLRRVVHQAEKVFHGNPSGLDGAASVRGGICLFKRLGADDEGLGHVDNLALKLPRLVVGFSGITKMTAALVERVRSQYETNHVTLERALDAIEGCLQTGLEAWRSWNLERLGEAMNENHRILQQLGVSCESLDRMVVLALEAGALGAKMTGAGGGGCVIALAPQRERSVIATWQKAGFFMFTMMLGHANAH